MLDKAAFHLRLLLVALLAWPALSLAGPNDRYWVGPAGGDFANAAHWSTSGNATCGAGGAGAPSTTHSVHFTSKCVTNATISGAVSVQVFEIAAGYTGTITQNSGATITTGGNFSQAAGTFNGSDAAITVNGSFTVSAGTFTSTSATLTAATGFSVAGTFNHNSGTVQLFTAGSQNATISVSGSQPFNNLKIGGNFDTNTLTVSTALVVNGTLTYASSGSVPATVNTSGIAVKGDVVQGTAGAKGTSVLTISGTGAQTLYGGGAAALPALNINKPSGTLTLSGTIATGANWTYTAGTLATSGSTVKFFTAASQTIALTGSHALDNVTIGGAYASDTLNVGAGTTLTVNGALRFDSAENMRATTNGGAIVAQGDIYQASGGAIGTTTLTIAGTGDQTYYGHTPGTTVVNYSVGSSPPVTINKPSGTLYLTGSIAVKNSWTYLSGTINPGTSTLHLFPDSGQTVTISGSHAIYHLHVMINTYSATVALAGGTTLTVNGDWKISSGQALTMNGGTLELKRHILGGGAGAAGTTNLLLSGSNAQKWSGGPGIRYPGTVTIDKSAETVTLTNPLMLDATQALNIVSGTLDQGFAGALQVGALTVGTSGVLKNTSVPALTLGGDLVNNGLIDIRRSSCGSDNVNLLSTSPGVSRSWSGSGRFLIQDVWVQDQGGSAAITAYSSTKGTNVGANWTFNPGCSVTTLTAPTDNSMYTAPATIDLAANAASTGPVDRVEFYRNGVLIGSDATNPYTYSDANLGAGTYTYTATTFDTGGTAVPSTPVTVSVTAVNAQSINVAAQTNGGVASASRVAYDDPAGYLHGVNNSVRNGTGPNQHWSSGNPVVQPVWLQITFDGAKTIGEVDLFMYQDSTPAVPTPEMTFTSYGLTAFQLQYQSGASWVDVPNTDLSGNSFVWRRLAFAPIATSAIRVLTKASAYASYAMVEVEAWTVEGQAPPTGTLGGFNAFEPATAGGAIAGDIRTKVAGPSFALDVVALNADRSAVLTDFTGDVKIELLDASNNTGELTATCRSTWTPIAGSATTLTFAGGDAGRKQVTLSTSNVWRDVRVRISHPTDTPTTTSCSTNNFAIRPSGLTLSVTDTNSASAGGGRALNNGSAWGGVVHKAGQPFTISAAAPAAATNYAGSPTVKSLNCLLPAGCANGTLALGAFAGSGTRTATATYSEAGTFSLELEDASFAEVDASDNPASDRTIPQAGGAIRRPGQCAERRRANRPRRFLSQRRSRQQRQQRALRVQRPGRRRHLHLPGDRHRQQRRDQDLEHGDGHRDRRRRRFDQRRARGQWRRGDEFEPIRRELRGRLRD